jgi:tetratricopeptide (TPR) repeat protein
LYDPNFFEAYLARAAFNHSRQSFIEGIEDCNKALNIEATSIRAHLLRGACQCKLGDYTAAIVDFTKATNVT